jgi:hypothetical protein
LPTNWKLTMKKETFLSKLKRRNDAWGSLNATFWRSGLGWLQFPILQYS